MRRKVGLGQKDVEQRRGDDAARGEGCAVELVAHFYCEVADGLLGDELTDDLQRTRSGTM